MKKVSVVIPTYNDASFIEKCINSVIQQSYKNTEIIVINDGSTDETKIILEKYKKDIRIIHQRNSGPSATRNKGIELATGEYISFVDGDDWIVNNCIEKLVDTMEKNNSDVAIGGQNLVKVVNKEVKIIKKLGLKNANLVSNSEIFKNMYPFFNTLMANPPCGRIYKKDIIIENELRFRENLTLGEDFIFNLEYFSVIDRCSLIEDIIYIYRQGKNFLTSKYSGDFIDNKMKMYNLAEMILRGKGVPMSFLNRQFIYIVFSYLMEIPSKLKDKKLKEKLVLIDSVIQIPQVRQAMGKSHHKISLKILSAILETKNPLIIYLFSKLLNWIRLISKVLG